MGAVVGRALERSRFWRLEVGAKSYFGVQHPTRVARSTRHLLAFLRLCRTPTSRVRHSCTQAHEVHITLGGRLLRPQTSLGQAGAGALATLCAQVRMRAGGHSHSSSH